MRKKIVFSLLIVVFSSMVQADIKPGAIDYIVRPLYGYRTDGAPGRIVTVRLKGEELKGDLSVEVITKGKTEKNHFALNAKDSTEVDVLLPATVPTGRKSEVTFVLRGADKTYKQKVSITPMRHWNVYLYNHAHVDIGYTNTHKNVELLHKNNIIEGIKLAEETKNHPDGARLMALEKENYPYDYTVLSWSLWDNNPLDADVPFAVKEWNERYAYPKIIISGGHEIMSMIEEKYGDQLPVVSGDYTEYWTDGLGTAAGLTAKNRNAKEKLVQAETIWSMLADGGKAPREDFDEAWRYILLGSEHTWCFENPTEPYFQDAIWKVKQSYFHEAEDRSIDMLDESLAPATDKSNGALGPKEGPANGGIAVFNTHSWPQSGVIRLTAKESLKGDKVVDQNGKELLSQRLSTGELLVNVPEVPALSSRHFRVVEGKCSLSGSCKIEGTTLENDCLTVHVDRTTGNIVSLLKKGSEYNYIAQGANTFSWLPANVDAPQADTVLSVSVVEEGPLAVELCVTSKATGCRSVSRSVRLQAGQPWVEISNVVDKLPLVEKDGIHFGFAFNLPNSKTRVDIPWGVMEVEKDQWSQGNRNWLAMQRWLDVSNATHGVTWCSLDAPLFEYGDRYANIAMGWGGKGNWVTRLEPSSTVYSWAMNNHWHTNFPLTQDGPVRFRYRLYPHEAYDVVEANRFGMEQSQPLVYVTADKDPQVQPLIAIDNQKVYSTIIKSLETDHTLIIRLRSLSDKEESVKLSFPKKTPARVSVCDREEIAGERTDGNLVMAPYGQITLRLEY